MVEVQPPPSFETVIVKLMRFFVFLLISTEITPRLPLTFSGPLGSPPGGLPFETSSWFVGLPQFPIRWHTFHANFQFGTVRRFHVSTIRLNFMLHRIGATSNKRNQDKRVCFIKLKFPFAQWRRMKNQPAHWTRIHLNFPSLLGRSPSKKKSAKISWICLTDVVLLVSMAKSSF